MGEDFIITVTAGKKQYQIRPQNGPYQESIETLSGNYKVNIEMKDGVSIRDIKYPMKAKSSWIFQMDSIRCILRRLKGAGADSVGVWIVKGIAV